MKDISRIIGEILNGVWILEKIYIYSSGNMEIISWKRKVMRQYTQCDLILA